MAHLSEVELIFPKTIGTEIESSLRTMKDLPEGRRSQINNHISSLIQEKRIALFNIKDKPGNEAAFFLIGMLFVWESVRISLAGSAEERMRSIMIQYKTPEDSTILGFANIGKYFFEKYKAAGGDDPGYLQVVEQVVSTLSNR